MAHVLVVDDDDGIRDSMRMALEDVGHEVFDAPNGVVALDLLRASPHPLVVVLDLVMRDGDGRSLLNAVREDPCLSARHCFLVATATPPSHLQFPDEITCLLALPVIQRPFDLDDFLAAVEQAAQKLPQARHVTHTQRTRRGKA